MTWIFSVHFQEKMLWELMTWTHKGKCFDLSLDFPNLCKMYGDQSEEFVCAYCGLKS